MTLPPPVRIREAGPGDLEAVGNCLSEAFGPFRNEYTPAGYADTVPDRGGMLARKARMTILVAETAEPHILGTVSYSVVSPSEGHLRGMAVVPSAQGGGVADLLLEAAISGLQARGVDRVTLNTTRPLRRATRFYERNGFRRTGVIGDYFGMELIEMDRAVRIERAV